VESEDFEELLASHCEEDLAMADLQKLGSEAEVETE
jgi:hypothetical protein